MKTFYFISNMAVFQLLSVEGRVDGWRGMRSINKPFDIPDVFKVLIDTRLAISQERELSDVNA